METLSTSKKLGHKLKKTGYRIATAESCTGGLLASAITDVSGCSEYFDLGVVVYSPEQKNTRTWRFKIYSRYVYACI